MISSVSSGFRERDTLRIPDVQQVDHELLLEEAFRAGAAQIHECRPSLP
jgi:hypothetical protein